MTLLSGALRRAGILIAVVAVLLAPVATFAAETTVARYGDVLRTFNPALSAAQSQDMATHVLLMSTYYRLDARLLVAIVGVESSWHVGALSRSGAQGLGQLMPSTASGLDVLSADAYENLDGTARYLRRMVQQSGASGTEERYRLALASYNAGPQAVARYGGVPPFAQTQAYVAKVMALWHNLKTLLPEAGDSAALLAHTAARPPLAHVKVAEKRTVAPSPASSVAEYTPVETSLMEADPFYPTPDPSPVPKKTLKRWFMRAFGIAKQSP